MQYCAHHPFIRSRSSGEMKSCHNQPTSQHSFHFWLPHLLVCSSYQQYHRRTSDRVIAAAAWQAERWLYIHILAACCIAIVCPVQFASSGQQCYSRRPCRSPSVQLCHRYVVRVWFSFGPSRGQASDVGHSAPINAGQPCIHLHPAVGTVLSCCSGTETSCCWCNRCGHCGPLSACQHSHPTPLSPPAACPIPPTSHWHRSLARHRCSSSQPL